VKGLAARWSSAGLLAAEFLALTVITALVVVGLTSAVDHAVYAATQPLASGFGDWLASAASLLGRRDVALIIAGVAVALLLAFRRSEALIPLFLPVVFLADGTLKDLVARARPPAGAAHDVQLIPMLLPKATETFSFPSSHAALVAFLAVALGAAIPKWRALLWVLAVAAALSRIYLDKHWLSDVVGGLVLGILVGTFAQLATRRVAALWAAWRAEAKTARTPPARI
jgi:membrane-associated phospholipid phosphatase